MAERIPVLIVGAGPSGLMMAACLHHHGIEYRLIEKRMETTQTSNALVMHPRTLEMLDDIGIIDPFIKQGQRIKYLSFNLGKENLAKISTVQIESFYNFMLSIPQNISETILDHHLNTINHPVERGLSLISIDQTQDAIIANLIDNDQKSQKIHCEYLIACDGIHSTTRELCHMKFSGIDIPQQFILGDAHIPSDFPDDTFTIYFHQEGPLAIFPFKKGIARIIATIIDSDRDPKQPVSLLELQKIIEKRSDNLVTINDVNWTSSFWIHSKMLNNFRQGNIFFMGDAAHIHSPVGGQGMNTGMQDAYNLAWKLALKMKGKGKHNLLDSYDDERKPNAKALLANTEHITRMILIKSPLLQWIRRKALKFFMKEKYMQHAFIMEMSMLSLHYKNSPIINYEYHVSPKGPLSGHRAPDVEYMDRDSLKRMDDLLRNKNHTLLIFTGKRHTQSAIEKIRAVEEWADEHETLIHPVIIVYPTFSDEFSDQCPLDKNHDLHRAYYVTKPSFFMIRPDNYIGCCSAELDLELLDKYIQHIFD